MMIHRTSGLCHSVLVDRQGTRYIWRHTHRKTENDHTVPARGFVCSHNSDSSNTALIPVAFLLVLPVWERDCWSRRRGYYFYYHYGYEIGYLMMRNAWKTDDGADHYQHCLHVVRSKPLLLLVGGPADAYASHILPGVSRKSRGK